MESDALVIGAGLSGLIAANIIQNAGKTVTILEKESTVGGRLATTSIGQGLADLGAQFFSVRTDTFQHQVDQWLEQDLVSVWGYGWSDGSLKRTAPDGHPRYVATGGMNQLAQTLSETLTSILAGAAVTQIRRHSNHWEVTIEGNRTFTGKTLVMTPPVPQALNLLKSINLADQDRAELNRIQFDPCLCCVFVVDGEVNFPEPGALQNRENKIYWMADNQAKGISPDERVITLHANVLHSRKFYDEPDDVILESFRTELTPYLAENAVIKSSLVKKWPYSVPRTTFPNDVLKAEGYPLVFAGDAFGGRGRVEGAYLSGYAAGHAVLAML